jgi:hypothetical protein
MARSIIKYSDTTKDKFKRIEENQNEQDKDILNNMLAIIEIFEMTLTITGFDESESTYNIRNEKVDKMIEVYVKLIQKQIKTIEDIPKILREQVKERLELLY